MRKIRVWLVLLLTAILISGSALPVLAIDIPKADTENIYVQDFAKVISSETAAYILEKNNALFETTGAQIVVATVDYTDGYDIEDYAYEMFNTYKIGSSEQNNGVLLLLVIKEENYWVMVGKGLENQLSAGTLKHLLDDYLENDFASADYDAGVRKFFDALYGELQSIYHTNPSVDYSSSPLPERVEYVSYGSIFTLLLFALVFVVFLIIVLSVIFARPRYMGMGPMSPPLYRPRRYRSPFWFGGPITRQRRTRWYDEPMQRDNGPTTRERSSPNVLFPGSTIGRPSSGSPFSGGGSFKGGGGTFGGGGSRGGGAGRR